MAILACWGVTVREGWPQVFLSPAAVLVCLGASPSNGEREPGLIQEFSSLAFALEVCRIFVPLVGRSQDFRHDTMVTMLGAV